MTKPTVIDLFAGCGGMTVGFASEGFEPVLAVEWDRFAAATYAANWGEDHVIPGDIAEVKEKSDPDRGSHDRRPSVPRILKPGSQGARRPEKSALA